MVNSWKSAARLALAFVPSPFAAGLVAFLYASSMPVVHHWTGQDADLCGVAGFGVIIGYAAAIVIGIPLYLLLRFAGRNEVLTYVVAGALAGLLTFEMTWPGGIHSFILLATRGRMERGASLFLATLQLEIPCVMAGLLAALVFWFIARPDRNVRA